MFVAIKDNKIIAYNKTGEFHCLNYDEIKEVDDVTLVEVDDVTLVEVDGVTLVEVDGEFLPDTDEKVIEQQKIEKSNQVKSIRNQYMSDTLARCDRYEKQTAAGLDTTDTAAMYYKMLIYLQYLRDIPQLENFPDIKVLSFEQWTIGATGLRTTDDRNGE